MSRFVDIEPMIKDLTAMKSVYDAIALDGMIKALREAPTADVEEVVRCRDCKHSRTEKQPHYCDVWRRYKIVGVSGFCNYGERKEDE